MADNADAATDDNWQEMWDARERALTAVLGATDGTVGHAAVPFYMGGQADVLCFPNHIAGQMSATCELLGCPDQIPNDQGTYELLVAHRDDDDWGANVISHLARYTCEACLDPLQTMDIGSACPKKATVSAFLFFDYARFNFLGTSAGLLLCLGITAKELKKCRAGKTDAVIAALKDQGVYPYTDLFRPSVV